MIRSIYRFHFNRRVSMEDVEKALALSVIAARAIHGEAAMRVDGNFAVDRRSRTCTIDRDTDLGCDLAKAMTGFLRLFMNDFCYEVEQDETEDSRRTMFRFFKVFLR